MTVTGSRDVVAKRVLDAPPEEVWKAWSEPEYLMRWWGPTGFTSPSADVDFREGGTSLVCMRAPAEFGGMDLYNTWTYRRIVPHERIEFDFGFTDGDRVPVDPPPGVPDVVRHVITFAPVDGGRTELTVTEHGYATDEAHDMSKAGLEQCLDKMAAIYSS